MVRKKESGKNKRGLVLGVGLVDLYVVIAVFLVLLVFGFFFFLKGAQPISLVGDSFISSVNQRDLLTLMKMPVIMGTKRVDMADAIALSGGGSYSIEGAYDLSIEDVFLNMVNHSYPQSLENNYASTGLKLEYFSGSYASRTVEFPTTRGVLSGLYPELFCSEYPSILNIPLSSSPNEYVKVSYVNCYEKLSPEE